MSPLALIFYILTVSYLGKSLRIPKSNVMKISSISTISMVSVDAPLPNTSRTATLPLGNIVGQACEWFEEVTEFLGIPFAKPPVGELRFRPPVAYDMPYPLPAYDATTTPAPCGSYQGSIGGSVTSVNSSEDCLYMNLWAPAWAVGADANLPVRVFIHGGRDLECSASDPYLNGCNYALKAQSISINIQFRKGPFGFLAHPATMDESNTTGNWAIMDMQLAFKWIKENVKSFGGNPDEVMINGNSAGGEYVELLQVSPLSNGLYTSALAQSPPCVRLITLHEAYDTTKSMMKDLNCPQSDYVTEMECLRNVSWSDMYTLAADVSDESGLSFAKCESLSWRPTFMPVQDGTVFPHSVMQALQSGAFVQVPYMVGYSAQEGTQFMASTSVNATTFTELLEEAFPGADLGPLTDLFPREMYADIEDPESARTADLWTDLFFSCPIYERMSARQPKSHEANFMYKWAVTPSCPDGADLLGASHGSEIMFTYGIVQQINPPSGTCSMPEAEIAMSDLLINAWKRMSEVGAPQWKNGTSWVEWTPETQLGTLLLIDSQISTPIDIRRKCQVILETRNEALQIMFGNN